MILLDSNVLLRLANARHPHHIVARKAIRILLRRPEKPIIVPQNLYEFWSVATRPIGQIPSTNGLGLSVERADFWLDYWLRTFFLLEDRSEIRVEWRVLVRTLAIRGGKSHDARLVAAMQAHNITELLTFNIQDFKRFPNITIMDPHSF